MVLLVHQAPLHTLGKSTPPLGLVDGTRPSQGAHLRKLSSNRPPSQAPCAGYQP